MEDILGISQNFLTATVQFFGCIGTDRDHGQAEGVPAGFDAFNNLLVSRAFNVDAIPANPGQTWSWKTEQVLFIFLHCQNSIAFSESGYVGCSSGQNCRDVLQWRVQLAVDRL